MPKYHNIFITFNKKHFKMQKYLITIVEPVGKTKYKEIEEILKIHNYTHFTSNQDPFRTDETRHYLVDLDKKTKQKIKESGPDTRICRLVEEK